jgi:serine/threonine protein kinase
MISPFVFVLVRGQIFIFSFIFCRTTLRLESLEDAVVLESEDDLLSDKHGCPAYVSPEILRTNSQYSGRAADMWGLGVMLYTMLVGRYATDFVYFEFSFLYNLLKNKLSNPILVFSRYPFHGQEHTGLFAKIRRGQFTLPDSISSRAKCLIRCLLRKDPTQRLTTEDVLIHPWVTLATPPSACHTSSSRESRRVSTATSGSGSSSATSMTSSNGGGNQLTPQMLTTPLGATLSLSGSSNLNSSSTSSSHHHSGLDSMDQLVPEFFPPQDEMDYSPFKY